MIKPFTAFLDVGRAFLGRARVLLRHHYHNTQIRSLIWYYVLAASSKRKRVFCP
ncbi:hypothetical protein SAMN05421780_1132 [Flexibacter flexilis DSM 6793]|uniref:Uncharacterized protein n=1 Tax=Flexibacter flexilis DSM 6793 TaxID=927664 RepID=A0A1I1N5S1_9BACT|nr:hypothetical protein SAMN05421780_1132 [Flexibacter flexilis DSM 6793]